MLLNLAAIPKIEHIDLARRTRGPASDWRAHHANSSRRLAVSAVGGVVALSACVVGSGVVGTSAGADMGAGIGAS